MFAANEFPTILDSSGACYERAMCFPFDNFIPEKMRNIHLSEELKKERSGILLWALQGRARLLKRGRFIESAAMLALKNKVKVSNDPVLGWFEAEKMTFDRTVSDFTVVSWWNRYKNYCNEENQKQNKRSEFIETLKAIPGISISRPSNINQECISCDWVLIDPPDMGSENNNEQAFVPEILAVTEANKQTVPQVSLCQPVVAVENQEVTPDVDETPIIAMVQSNILQQDEDWSAFN